MSRRIRLAGIAYESLVNGPGMRRVLFAQGCKHNCAGCFNPETHDFSGGEEMDMDEIIKDIAENPMLKGVTFSGGDPLEQAEEFAYIAEKVKALGLNVWCYTGYTYEYIIKNLANDSHLATLLNNIDVLVDGRFDISKTQNSLRFRGSTNQRFIDVKESLESGLIKELSY